MEKLKQLCGKFQQRDLTQAVALDLFDSYMLGIDQKVLQTEQSNLALVMATCMMLASKFDEIDDNITLIKDIQDFTRKNPNFFGSISSSREMLYTEIVSCEKRLLRFFEWDLHYVMPIHFIKSFLVNGIVFGADR